MSTEPTHLLTSAEASSALGVSRSTLIRLVIDGRIVPAQKMPGIRGGYLFDPVEVERVATEVAA